MNFQENESEFFVENNFHIGLRNFSAPNLEHNVHFDIMKDQENKL